MTKRRATCWLVAVTGSLLLGCGAADPPPAADETPSLRFIEHDPREVLNFASLSGREEPVAEWGFEGADLAGWRQELHFPIDDKDEPSTATPVISTNEDGLELPVGLKFIRLERAVNVDAAAVEVVGIEVGSRKRLPDVQRWKVAMRWATREQLAAAQSVGGLGLWEHLEETAPGQWAVGTSVSPSPQEALFRFFPASHPGWKGRLDLLLFEVKLPVASSRGGMAVRRAYAASGVLDREQLAALARTGCKIEVDRQVRNSLPALPGLPIERRLEVPPQSELRFGYAVPEGNGGVRFRILVTAASEPETLFDVLVGGSESGRWHEGVVDLRRFAGQRVVLRLVTASEQSRRLLGSFPVWGDPEVVTPAGKAGRSEDVKRINIVIVSLDTLRADHLGLYGYSRPTSPHLDRLASESVVFDLAIAQAPATFHSHSSLFQSRFPSRLDDSSPVVADVLRAAGYRTAAFTAGGSVSAKLGFARGFDLYSEDPEGFAASFERLEEWLRHSAREPFLLFVHTYDVHVPYDSPPPFDRMFFPDYQGPIEGEITTEVVKAVLARNSTGGALARYRPRLEIEELLPLSPVDRRWLIALYDGGVRYTDQFIGKLTTLLSELNLTERTAVVVFSDHGEELWDHGSLGHGATLYQEVIRVPLIFRLPAARNGGTRVPQAVRLVDLTPTLVSLAGIPPPLSFQGRSLLPLLAGKRLDDVAAVSELGRLKAVLRYPWKLITDERRKEMLFNLHDDPGEEKDLRWQYPEITEELKAELSRLLEGQRTVIDYDPEAVQDQELREQLRALGYLE